MESTKVLPSKTVHLCVQDALERLGVEFPPFVQSVTIDLKGIRFVHVRTTDGTVDGMVLTKDRTDTEVDETFVPFSDPFPY